MKKAYMFRIYPNKNQEVKMVRTLNTCRQLYNDALAERKKQAELNRPRKSFDVFPWGKPEWIFYEDQANELAADKDSFQKEVHSAKSIMNAGWYQLQTLTASKAEEAGKQVKLCIANGTSQTCHVCGNKQKMTLRDRIFRCNQCGNIENRDTNAANVILDRCTVGMTEIEACKSGLSIDIMKQEATLFVGW